MSIPTLTHKQKKAIKKKVLDWLEKTTKRLTKRIKARLAAVNPFLVRALGLSDEETHEFGVRQRVERSLVTSFGTLLQEIVKIINHEAGTEDIDLIIKKNGRDHYVQLKSGPQGFTRPALRKTSQSFSKIKQQNPNAVTVIAMAYGSEDNLSPIWGEEAKRTADLLLLGKDFWHYFWGRGAYNALLRLFEQAAKEFCRKKGFSGSVYDYILQAK